MGNCIICIENLANDEKVCPKCGFKTKIPVFLSETQYTEWYTEVVLPYMNEFIQKKALRQEELLTQAKSIAQKISEQMAADMAKEICETIRKSTVRESLSKMIEENRKSLTSEIENILSSASASYEPKEKMLKECVIFLQEDAPMRREEIPSQKSKKVNSEEWNYAKAQIRASFQKEIISGKEDRMEQIEVSVLDEMEKHIQKELQERNYSKIVELSEKIILEKGYSEAVAQEIEQTAGKIFTAMDESSTEKYRQQAKDSAEEKMKEALMQENKTILKRVETDVRDAQKKCAISTGERSEEKTMCVFGMDFYVVYHENTKPQVRMYGNNLMLKFELEKWNTLDLTAIAAGNGHVIALTRTGDVIAAGDNNLDQCDTAGWKNVVQIAACGANTAALDEYGKVHVCGEDEELKSAESWNNIRKIALGTHHLLGLKTDGTVVVTDNPYEDQSEVKNWKNIVDIAAGEYHSIGVTVSGTVKAAGSNLYGECKVSNWKDIIVAKAGKGISVGLQKDGKVLFAGEQISVPVMKGKPIDVGISQSGEQRCYYKVEEI